MPWVSIVYVSQCEVLGPGNFTLGLLLAMDVERILTGNAKGCLVVSE